MTEMRPPQARTAPAEPLVLREPSPPQLETTIEALGQALLTPVERFYVRNHGPYPEVDAEAWRLAVAGLVRHGRELSLADLRAFPTHDVAATLECAGNGRTAFHPQPPGIPWGPGAVGTAVWSGVRLADVFDAVGVDDAAAHVWFEGDDRDTSGEPRYVRSLPLAVARERVLLATHMNHTPLTREHGAPLRAIVPGWYAMASVKWLTRVAPVREAATGPEMTQSYCYWTQVDGAWRSTPVEHIRVKSMITTPLEGAVVPAGALRVAGFAWSSTLVTRVELSADGGDTWRDATLESPLGPHAWRAWHAELRVAPGPVTLLARATDQAGQVQPPGLTWNRDGYGGNAWTRVRVSAVPA